MFDARKAREFSKTDWQLNSMTWIEYFQKPIMMSAIMGGDATSVFRTDLLEVDEQSLAAALEFGRQVMGFKVRELPTEIIITWGY